MCVLQSQILNVYQLCTDEMTLVPRDNPLKVIGACHWQQSLPMLGDGHTALVKRNRRGVDRVSEVFSTPAKMYSALLEDPLLSYVFPEETTSRTTKTQYQPRKHLHY